MKISYVATDLEFDSLSDPSLIVAELGKNIHLNRNDQVGGVYYVTAGLGHPDTSADEAVAFYCSILEKLSDPAKVSWRQCTRRVLDIAFESGTEPKCETYRLSENLVRRVADLGISIAITVYRAGFYSDAS